MAMFVIPFLCLLVTALFYKEKQRFYDIRMQMLCIVILYVTVI
jgi:hypothetical protein